MFLKISFWLIAAILILPFPFKVYEHISGKDDSPKIVKIEEISNAIFMGTGLVGFYGFMNDIEFINPTFWKVWFIVAVLWSLSSFFWSPKLAYAKDILGKNKMRIAALVGVVISLPMLIAVYYYAFKI